MRLADWARKNSLSYRTAWEHFRTGKIPTAYKLPSGTIVVPDEEPVRTNFVVVYARVSSSENKSNLDSQAERVAQFCTASGLGVNQIVKECASGLNDKRPKLLAVLTDKKVTHIVVEHKDRLTRFGFNYIQELFPGKIIVINEVSESEADLMQDFVSLVTSFCARLYGKRRSKRNTEKLIASLTND